MNSNGHEPEQGGGSGGNMVGMMVMMMAMCFGVVLLFAIIPSIGWPLGIVFGVAGGGLMLFLHQRYMRHGSHRRCICTYHAPWPLLRRPRTSTSLQLRQRPGQPKIRSAAWWWIGRPH